ncbi:MAG: PEP-CTERM sorting domain-containing protein [Phycisphaerae bacterium]|nr:PEP-CTERM sorting domain-containing protein [Phycisphaerae bacterium]
MSIPFLAGDDYAYGSGLSADGSTLVGYSGLMNNGNIAHAIRWTASGGTEYLGQLPGGQEFSIAYGVSGNGAVAVGSAFEADPIRAFRWTSGGGMQALEQLSPTDPFGQAVAASADGSVITGCSGTQEFRAVRWTPTGIQEIGVLPGGQQAVGTAITPDGSVVVGHSGSANGNVAFRWTQTDGMQDLGKPSTVNSSFAQAVSADGSTIAAWGYSDTGSRLLRWTTAGGWADLGSIGGVAFGMTADGSMIVGYGDSAFLWTEALGIVDLSSYLAARGLDLSGWTLNEAEGISADGSVIMGNGFFNGNFSAWVVTIPSPGATTLLGLGGLMGSRRRR